MAKYRLTEPAYINNTLQPEGAIVEVADTVEPGYHMVPVDEAAKKIAKRQNLVNVKPPDYVDVMTGRPDVTAFGASPQNVASGMMFSQPSDAATGMVSPEPDQSA
jgi:hypothetical protein